jgi:topoisomerase IV subunit B
MASTYALVPTSPSVGQGQMPTEAFRRTAALVETLMGRRPELRFDYIQKNARFARDLDV